MREMTYSLLTLAFAACFSSSPNPSAAALMAFAISSCSVNPLRVSFAAFPALLARAFTGTGTASPICLPAFARAPGEVSFS